MREFGSFLFQGMLVALLLVVPMTASAQGAGTYASERIIGGGPADSGAYPWVVALVTHSAANPVQGLRCGGTLITSEWVLTAAHCVDDIVSSPGSVDAVVGQYDISSSGTGGERIRLKGVTLHPSYNASTDDNDIAVAQLERPVAVSTGLPAGLVTQGDPEGLAGVGKNARIIGWGSTSSTVLNTSSQLLQADVVILDQSTVRADYAATGLTITDNMLGALGTGQDTCQGDSGGPLAVLNAAGTGWTVAGITSWGIGCADSRYPGIYTRLSRYVTWVNQAIAQPAVVPSSGGGSSGGGGGGGGGCVAGPASTPGAEWAILAAIAALGAMRSWRRQP